MELLRGKLLIQIWFRKVNKLFSMWGLVTTDNPDKLEADKFLS